MSEAARGVAVLVAYYAPPAVGIAAQRLLGLLRYLPNFGWDPVLVAPVSAHYHRTAEETHRPLLPMIREVRVPNPEPSRWLRALGGGSPDVHSASPGTDILEVAPLQVGPVANWVRRVVRECLYIPDAQMLWIPGAAKAARGELRAVAGRRTVLFSTSVPFSAHFAARSAARATGTPWVAEYRDPWTAAPPQFGMRSALRGVVDQRLDHMIVSAADHVVVTAQRTRSLFLDAFPGLSQGEVSVVRNGWDEVDAGDVGSPPAPEEPLALVYAGSLLQQTWAESLLDGLDLVEAVNPGRVTLTVFGPRDPWDRLVAARGRSPMGLRLRGMVPGSEVAKALREASALVVLQPDASNYVPGKVYDYLGARRPVLADLPTGSEAELLVLRHGDLRSLAGGGAEGVQRQLLRLLAEHGAGRLSSAAVGADQVEPLSRRAQTAVLADIFDRVAGRG